MAGSLYNKSSTRRRRGGFKPNSEINVTPLVDVMLVLLIIFMVTAPILTVSVPVDLPKTTAAQTNDNIEPIVVSINKDGHTFLKDAKLDIQEIIMKLETIVADKPDAKIYVRGDQSLSYGRIMEVMGIVASAGFQRVSLIAEMPTTQHPLQAPTSPNNTQAKAPHAQTAPLKKAVKPNKISKQSQKPTLANVKNNQRTTGTLRSAKQKP